jgi:ribose 5-phosphate isomerase A
MSRAAEREPVVTGSDIKAEKRAAAETAVALVESGMWVGLGTGSTVAELVPALGARRLDITCAATSPATEELAIAHGLDVRPFTDIDRLDLAIDGADQVDPLGWLIKGGGGAQTRERIVAAAADRFVVIVSSDKPVDRLHAPVPLELLPFGLAATLRALPGTVLRNAPVTPDGGVIADYHGEVGDPAVLAAMFDAVPGLVSHGLFQPAMVSTVLIARGDEVEMRQIV